MSYNPNNFFSRLPKSTINFLVENAAKITRKTQKDDLESLLKKIGEILPSKNYGWEEAILSGLS